MSVKTKRIYALPSAGDGYRVLVDRLWPRGLSRSIDKVDLLLRDIAPSTDLRTWFDHQLDRWPDFREKYILELGSHDALLDLLLDIEQHHREVTLLFAARDEAHNEAEVLAEVIRARPRHTHH